MTGSSSQVGDAEAFLTPGLNPGVQTVYAIICATMRVH